MKILAFDTSQNNFSIAISVDNRIVYNVDYPEAHKQAEYLVYFIEKGLKESGISYEDLNYIAAAIGPGSFTGIRTGLAVVKGLSIVLGIPFIPITNFEYLFSIVESQIEQFDIVFTIIDAGRSSVYYQCFDKTGKSTTEPTLIQNSLLKAKIFEDAKGQRAALIGSGIINVAHAGKSSIQQDMFYLPRFRQIKARKLCNIAIKKIEKREYTFDVAPLYIRLPDAKKV